MKGIPRTIFLRLGAPEVHNQERIREKSFGHRSKLGQAGDGDDKPAGMGVKFCEMSEKDIKVFEEYLKKITGQSDSNKVSSSEKDVPENG